MTAMLRREGLPRAAEQATLASLERCALYLFRWLPFEVEERLVAAVHDVRWALRLPPPPHPLLDLRDWPADREAGDALGKLLTKLDELEDERPLRWSPTNGRG